MRMAGSRTVSPLRKARRCSTTASAVCSSPSRRKAARTARHCTSPTDHRGAVCASGADAAGTAARCRPDTAVRAGRDQRRRRDHTCDRLVRRQGRGLRQQHGYTVLPRARRRRRVLPADRPSGKLNTTIGSFDPAGKRLPGFHLHALPLPQSPFFNHVLQNDDKKPQFFEHPWQPFT